MMNGGKLKALQLIEVGQRDSMPPSIPIWDSKGISGGRKIREFNAKHSTCAICGINEPLIWHHIFTKTIKGKTSTSGTSKPSDFGNLLGLVHICPNCHYYIHQLNPFNVGWRGVPLRNEN